MEEHGPLVAAMLEKEKWEKGQLCEAQEKIGNVLSGIEMRQPRYQMLYDVMITLRGLIWEKEK